MNEERRDQIRSMLVDLVDNMDKPSDYETYADFKQDWLEAVADEAAALWEEEVYIKAVELGETHEVEVFL